MRVYVVTSGDDYEGDSVHGVHTNFDAALEAASDHLPDLDVQRLGSDDLTLTGTPREGAKAIWTVPTGHANTAWVEIHARQLNTHGGEATFSEVDA